MGAPAHTTAVPPRAVPGRTTWCPSCPKPWLGWREAAAVLAALRGLPDSGPTGKSGVSGLCVPCAGFTRHTDREYRGGSGRQDGVPGSGGSWCVSGDREQWHSQVREQAGRESCPCPEESPVESGEWLPTSSCCPSCSMPGSAWQKGVASLTQGSSGCLVAVLGARPRARPAVCLPPAHPPQWAPPAPGASFPAAHKPGPAAPLCPRETVGRHPSHSGLSFCSPSAAAWP